MAQTHLHVLLKFTSEPDADLQQTTTAVINGLYVDKAAYPAPPIDQPTLQGALTDFGTLRVSR